MHEFVLLFEQGASKYLRWLQEEGYSIKESKQMIDAALEASDFQLVKFPICLES